LDRPKAKPWSKKAALAAAHEFKVIVKRRPAKSFTERCSVVVLVPDSIGAADDISVVHRAPVPCTEDFEAIVDPNCALAMLAPGTRVVMHFDLPNGWCVGTVKTHKPKNKTYTTTVEYDEEKDIIYPHRFVVDSYGKGKLFVVLHKIALQI
jgi:hypothetical protein